MMIESLEQLRERLLREENIQQMIRVRAYEIYEMRGAQVGGPAQDWFEAESEVLAFLLAHESRSADNGGAEQPSASAPEAASPQNISTPPAKRAAAKKAKPAKSSTKRAKRASPKKPAESKPKPKRTRKGSKTDGNKST